MQRRTFIKNSSIAAAGLIYQPSLAFKEDPLLGQGNKRYRLNTHWSKADVAKNPVNDCHEMVQDSKGRIILLTNETKNNVLMYEVQQTKNDFIAGADEGIIGLQCHWTSLYSTEAQSTLMPIDSWRPGAVHRFRNIGIKVISD